MGDDVRPSSSCRTSWFRQRSTWWLKIVRSSLSWVSWHTGQTRTGPLSLRGRGRREVSAPLSPRIDNAVRSESFSKPRWSSWGSTPFDSHGADSFWPLSTSRSDSVSETVRAPGFLEASQRHRSICLLKAFKSVVSTCLKHTGQVRLSDSVPPQRDVDARASTGGTKSFSDTPGAAWVGGRSVEATAEPFSPPTSFWVLACAAWSSSRLACALWKKDCLGSSVVWPPCLIPQGTSSGLRHVCTRGRQAGGPVWKEGLGRLFFSSFSSVPWEGPLRSVLSCFRKPMMLLWRGFFSSVLTKAEILTPANRNANHPDKTKWAQTAVLFPRAVRHGSFRITSR